jgi:APA family basic amino acid/polyamine antiporter
VSKRSISIVDIGYRNKAGHVIDKCAVSNPRREPSVPDELRRRLGTFDAVVVGLGSMMGAGIFAALGPAAGAAGSGLLLGLVVAAVIAYCNAISSARLAARYPTSGGTYVYGRVRLGNFWGYLAGWAFVVGKTASCAAIWPSCAAASSCLLSVPAPSRSMLV